MATSEFVCGTGEWVGPKPGDPDNNIVLNATGTFGGIDVSWSYPATNPYAVAHTVLYRGLTDNFAGAVQHTIVAGNYFFDKFGGDEPVVYYYWVQMVSVNGTYAGIVGPATATARPSIEDTIRQLSGKIDQGALAQELRSNIDHIGLLDNTISGEIRDRIAANQALGVALNGVQSDVDSAITLIETEVTERINANSALLTSMNLMGVGFQNSVTGLVEEVELVATANTALASKITTVEATVNGDTATGQVGLTAKVNAVTGAVESMYTAKVGVNGLIGGFGLYNDGTVVEAGFDVDRFWVGKDDLTIKPFIIENGEVFINKAAIQTLTADKIDTRGLVIRDTEANGGGIIFGAGNALDWGRVGGSNKPADGATVGSNLIRKGTFDDGYAGSWSHEGIESRINTGMPYAKNIYFHARDNLENGADFAVTPGEILYGSAWLETKGISSYPGYLGVRIEDAAGVAIGWNTICGIGPETDWTYVKGSTVVPAGGVKAVPWVTLAGYDFPIDYQWLRAAGLYIGRHEQGATVGAPAGTVVGNTLAETVESNAAAGKTASDSVANKLDKASAAILNIDSTSAVRMAGVKVGDLSWDASGYRTSGKGIAITPKGVLGHNGSKTTFAIDSSSGEAVFSGSILASSFKTGALTQWGWPAAGSGSGSYLGPEGLLLGNANDGKYFQVGADGNMQAPGMKIENGVLTISQANVIDTLQLAGNSVTVSSQASGTAQSVSTTLTIPPNTTMAITAVASIGTFTSEENSFTNWAAPQISVAINGEGISDTHQYQIASQGETWTDYTIYATSISYGKSITNSSESPISVVIAVTGSTESVGASKSVTAFGFKR